MSRTRLIAISSLALSLLAAFLVGKLSLPAQAQAAPKPAVPRQLQTPTQTGAQGKTTATPKPQPTPGLPTFEVASIRPSPPNHGYTDIGPFGAARFTMTNASLSFIVQMAFDVTPNKLSGQPAWLDTLFFDIAAKAEDDAHLTYEQVKPRLQQLLEQRFHLAAHRETKSQPGYLLLVGKGAPKLEATQGGAPYGYLNAGKIRLRNAPLTSLAGALTNPIGSPVVDKTGIEGNYDFKLDFASDTPADPPLPSIFTALQEQLGLRLEPQQVALEIIVIDHIDKTPTEN